MQPIPTLFLGPLLLVTALTGCADFPDRVTRGDAQITDAEPRADGAPTDGAVRDATPDASRADAAGHDMAVDAGDAGSLDVGRVPDARPDAADGPSLDMAVDAGPDMTVDAGPDMTVDLGPDVAVDAGPDMAVDAGPDMTVDLGQDTTVDLGPDVTVDLGPDMTVDAGPDMTVDAGPDMTVDAGPDMAVDAGPDMTVDAGPDMAVDAGPDDAPLHCPPRFAWRPADIVWLAVDGALEGYDWRADLSAGQAPGTSPPVQIIQAPPGDAFHQVAPLPNGLRAVALGAEALYPIDLARGTVGAAVALGGDARALHVAPDGLLAVVTLPSAVALVRLPPDAAPVVVDFDDLLGGTQPLASAPPIAAAALDGRRAAFVVADDADLHRITLDADGRPTVDVAALPAALGGAPSALAPGLWVAGNARVAQVDVDAPDAPLGPVEDLFPADHEDAGVLALGAVPTGAVAVRFTQAFLGAADRSRADLLPVGGAEPWPTPARLAAGDTSDAIPTTWRLTAAPPLILAVSPGSTPQAFRLDTGAPFGLALPAATDVAFPTPVGVERCNGIDDDCDGTVDEGFDLGAECPPLGTCGAGVWICGEDGQRTCSTRAPGPDDQRVDETCDARDNDCDGLVDEDAPVEPVDSVQVNRVDGDAREPVISWGADGGPDGASGAFGVAWVDARDGRAAPYFARFDGRRTRLDVADIDLGGLCAADGDAVALSYGAGHWFLSYRQFWNTSVRALLTTDAALPAGTPCVFTNNGGAGAYARQSLGYAFDAFYALVLIDPYFVTPLERYDGRLAADQSGGLRGNVGGAVACSGLGGYLMIGPNTDARFPLGLVSQYANSVLVPFPHVLPVEGAGVTARQAALVAGVDRFHAAWVEDAGVFVGALPLVDGDDGPQAVALEDVVQIAPAGAEAPAIALGTHERAVAYVLDGRVWLARVAADGRVRRTPVSTDGRSAAEPALTWNGTQYALVWREADAEARAQVRLATGQLGCPFVE